MRTDRHADQLRPKQRQCMLTQRLEKGPFLPGPLEPECGPHLERWQPGVWMPWPGCWGRNAGHELRQRREPLRPGERPEELWPCHRDKPVSRPPCQREVSRSCVTKGLQARQHCMPRVCYRSVYEPMGGSCDEGRGQLRGHYDDRPWRLPHQRRSRQAMPLLGPRGSVLGHCRWTLAREGSCWLRTEQVEPPRCVYERRVGLLFWWRAPKELLGGQPLLRRAALRERW
ncbi:hypothetical protein [Mumia zhuanghuii]|uniref:Uncharacterized protein n=1 Tax=Mumia zhuanghuii TaxID=2585211 RepID=A0A5C4M9H4_9ACTN|nr:hypothetical protein [Mumia zhuanghuii]TNC28438.1 hypothetical protein FHE65_34015 [Mumia zhuanghuii]